MSPQNSYTPHSHGHGAFEPVIFTTRRGIRAIQWSFLGLLTSASLQLVIAILSGSMALLSDTIHNIADAGTSLPLWIAFRLARWKPTKRFTYGLGRVEDLAGVVILFTIIMSTIVAGWVSIQRFLHPMPVKYLGAVMVASLIGFFGNEAVAAYRIRVGREIGSAALVADGYHARVDGFTSLAVLAGALGVWLGFPKADPVAGLLIAVAILRVAWQSGKAVFGRLLDGVEPEIVDEVRNSVARSEGVLEVTEVRVRWLGHRLHAEVNITVLPELSVEKGHQIANRARHALLHHLSFLSNATIHTDPAGASGERHHQIRHYFPSDFYAP